MTKFWPGDQVICINAGPLYSARPAPDWLVEGRIYTVSYKHDEAYEEQEKPRLILKGLEDKIPYLERFAAWPLPPPPDADADYLEILNQQETYLALKD